MCRLVYAVWRENGHGGTRGGGTIQHRRQRQELPPDDDDDEEGSQRATRSGEISTATGRGTRITRERTKTGKRHHHEFDKSLCRKDEKELGKGYCQDWAKKEGHHHGYSNCPKPWIDPPCRSTNRKRMSSAGKGYDCISTGLLSEPQGVVMRALPPSSEVSSDGSVVRSAEKRHVTLPSDDTSDEGGRAQSKHVKVMRVHSPPVMAGNSSFKLDNATLYLFQSTNTSMAISVVYAIVTIVNLVGNGFSMWILLFRTSPKTPSIIFMLHLTLTDLALGTALPFQIAYQLQGYHWNLGPNMCSFLTLVFYTNMYCSILTMMAIGIDRYLGIVRPMFFRETRERKTLAVFSCLLMWAIVLSVLHPMMTTDLTFDIPELGITSCFDMLKKDMLPSKTAWLLFVFGMVFVLFFFPFCITTFCYIRVIRKLSQDSKTMQKERAIRLAVVVILVFTFCFAPNNFLLFAHSITKLFYNKSLYVYYKLTLCLSCFNSCLDPFIYYFASKDFRQKLRHIMNLRSQSSADSTRLERKDSMYSAHYTFEGHEGEHSKVSLMPQNASE